MSRTAYQQARHEWIDPGRVRWAPTPVDRAAVEHYKQHPNQPYGGAGDGDGDPFIIRRPTGELVGCNGKHRAIAAAETGRQLWARVHTEPPRAQHAGAGTGRRRVESNDIELMFTIAANAIRAGYLLAGTTERVYARNADHRTNVVRVPGWEDDAVHQLLTRRWLTRAHTARVHCGAVHLTATTVGVPRATRARITRWRHQ